MGDVPQQQTLRETAAFEGVGLHSGSPVSMTFLPAPPNTGIRFRRVDLEGRPEIEARKSWVREETVNIPSKKTTKKQTRITLLKDQR